MSFQCHDLDRAFEFPELMPDARAHAETCERCRKQIELWSEISRLAPQLHQEWESPGLWGRIRSEIAAAPRRRRQVLAWRWALAAAAAVTLGVLLWHSSTGIRAGVSGTQARMPVLRSRQGPNQALLTEDALHEVQQAEAAYARSIEKLSAVAGPSLDQTPSPLAGAYREKLAVLDSAIADLKATIETNRYNAYLQTQLESLYREKQKTLEEWLKNAKHS
jgi:hypothetical protein